ncbi:MAG TPA: hypothetical protein VHQ96_06260 [Gaiellaceae bacterium]|nr:hypothetical protein [Gaiellaceae bacterium]
MRLRWLVVLAFAGAALIGGGSSSGASTPVCSTSGPRVCVDLVGTPATVAPSGETAHYVNYVSHVSNQGNRSATHVTADVDLTGGLVLVSATSSTGTCSISAEPTCTIGRLASGSTATVQFVARAPETEGTASASLEARFDETNNDSPTPDPKQDSVLVQEHTTVKVPDGSAASFVPKGASLTLTTDPTDTGVTTATDPLIGQAVITTSSVATTASIDEVSAPFTCPKKVVCRGGDWFHADIPGTFNPPLAFPLRWDKTLIPTSLTVRKFALIYTECLNGCKLQIISARCSSSNPNASELPCLTGVAKLSDGDYVATLISNHNGHMR